MIYVMLEDFKKIYTGIIIAFSNKSFSIKKEVVNKRFISLITVIILFLSFLNIVYSFLLSHIIENEKFSNKLLFTLTLFASIGLIKELINFIKEKTLLKYQIITDRAITIPSLKKIINLPHEFYQKRSVGELISKINDLSYIKQMSFVMVQVLFVNVIIMLVSFMFLFFVNKYVLILNIFVVLVVLLYNKNFFNKHSYKNYDLQIKNEVLNTKISDGINSIINVKNLCKEKYLQNKIINSYEDAISSYKELNTLYQKKDLLFNLIIFISSFCSVAYLCFSKSSISNILFVTYIESIIFDCLGQIGNLHLLYADFKSTYVRLKSIYDEKEIDNNLELIDINSISFRNITYKYKDKLIFKDINLNINKNDFIMINGPSGCGKTTLFKMLTRQVKHNGKNIFINNKSINSYEDGSLRRSITYVDQKIKFFSDTILENITLGNKFNLRPHFKSILEKILKERNIDYTTVIDNTNSNLSGGELMLISIAQALNNAGSVIIFDETTSQMDVKLEYRVLKAIKEDYKDKTIILISHRMSNVNLFDKIHTFSDNKNNRRKNEKIKRKRIKTN